MTLSPYIRVVTHFVQKKKKNKNQEGLPASLTQCQDHTLSQNCCREDNKLDGFVCLPAGSLDTKDLQVFMKLYLFVFTMSIYEKLTEKVKVDSYSL